ncbi:ATP-binding protein [Streptomyces sp. NPDC014882]|uniref:ATP-binding protein n=1 Tax=Streptomyces sp. NPDC014882 TaxID=3364927 RepID=UPI0036F56F40
MARCGTARGADAAPPGTIVARKERPVLSGSGNSRIRNQSESAARACTSFLREGAPVFTNVTCTRQVLAVAVLPSCPRGVPRLRLLTHALAQSHRLSEAAQKALSVVISELSTDVVLHSGSPDLAVTLEIDGASPAVAVRDRGRRQDRPIPRCEAMDMDADFGRGLALVDAYCVDRSARCSAEGTVMRAVIVFES